MTRLVIAALALISTLAACSPRRPPATLHELAEAYVRITLQFAQHRPNLVDAWLGPADWRPGPRLPVADLRARLDELVARAERVKTQDIDPTEAPRLNYLRGQLRALTLVARRLAGDATPFDEEVRLLWGARVADPNEAELHLARATIDRELPGDGPLVDRYTAFRRRFLVAGDQTARILAAAITACRETTAPHVPLPGDERVDVDFDSSIEWNANADYLGDHHTRIRVASRSGHDTADLLHLACHESYAGHHLQHILIDDALVKGRGWMEFQLTPAFGPHVLIAEGAAEVAVDLALPQERRAAIYRDRLLPLAAQPAPDADRLARIETLAATLEQAVPRIVQRYLDNVVSAEATEAALRESVLMPSPKRFLAFVERHRTVAVTYPIGRAVVASWISRARTEPDRWRRLQDLFTRDPFTLD